MFQRVATVYILLPNWPLAPDPSPLTLLAYRALFWSFFANFCAFCASLWLKRTVFSWLLKQANNHSSLILNHLPKAPSRPIRSLPTYQVGPCNPCNLCPRYPRLINDLCALCHYKSVKICVNPWLINDLRLRKITYEKITFLCKTNPISEKVK